jgi:putative hemolysin
VYQTSKYAVKIAESESDVRLAQSLRASQFGGNAANGLMDVDKFDAHYKHVLIEKRNSGELHACFRFKQFDERHNLDQSYSAQFYDLQLLEAFDLPMLEIGRFCVKMGVQDQCLLRVAWAFLTRYVDAHNIAFMFGCTSFVGTDQAEYTDAFALLKERYLAPAHWKPRVKSSEVFEFARQLKNHKPAIKAANRNMPPLLRTYLSMGGRVSDHAVVDSQLDTLHVFTGLDIAAIPVARATLLRADAQAF